MQTMKSVDILGVRVHSLSSADKAFVLHSLLVKKQSHVVVTVNPEIVMWAQKDRGYRDMINAADLSIADGVGLTFASRHAGQRLHRWTGYDFVLDLMGTAAKENRSVFLLGGKPLAAHKSALTLRKLYPTLRIAGAEQGPPIGMSGREIRVDESDQKYLIEHLRLLEPDILLVAFGHPKQEKWIARSLHLLPSVRVAVGVGGVFEYLSGSVYRAPWAMRVLGLEWLFRVVRQPWRLPRIITAVVRFTLAIWREKK